MAASHQEDSKDKRGSALSSQSAEPRFIAVGRIIRPHGVRGELRVELLTDYPDRLATHDILYLGPDLRPHHVEGVRFHKGAALLQLAGCTDRDAAEELRGQLIQIPLEEAVPLEEEEYYHFQMIGVQIFTEEGEHLGRIAEVIDTKANDVYVVRGPRGELLIPATEEVVQELDVEGQRMVVHILPGLLE